MDTFTKYFCYSKKQRYGPVDLMPPRPENPEDAETPIPKSEIEDTETPDEEDL